MQDQAPIRKRYDVVIVGARVAGAATAMLLARGGLKVLAVDRGAYGADTLSSHALMRPAVMQLQRWGLLQPIIDAGTPAITSTIFHYGDTQTEVAIRPEPGLPGLVAPRRTLLDRMLVDAARAAGAHVFHETTVMDLVRHADGRPRGVTLRTVSGEMLDVAADLIVGADGMNSPVANALGAEKRIEGKVLASHIYSYVPLPHSTAYHWYFRPGMAASLIPTNGGQACLVASVPQTSLSRLPSGMLATHLAIVSGLSPDLGRLAALANPFDFKMFRGARGFLRQSHGEGWALVGDAGFFRDPLTAHGISDALRDAGGLADAVLEGSMAALSRYGRERDEIAAAILTATDAVAAFDWSLDDLESRHRAFSQAMKMEVGFLSDRPAQWPRQVA